MKKRIFLHIGAHKTGSTSLQSWAVLNFDLLRRKDFYYVTSGRNIDGNHSEIAWALRGDSRAGSDIIARLIYEIKHVDESNILISGEEFEYLSQDHINDLRVIFDDFDVNIIIVLRPQHEIIRSQYTEWIKQFLTVDDFSIFWRFHVQLREYDFVALWERWVREFGEENVQLLSHPEATILPNGVISSILNTLRLDENDFHFESKKNASESSEIIFLWRYMLLKLQMVTGFQFGLYDHDEWTSRRYLFESVMQKYGSIIAETQKMYLGSNFENTKFVGYSGKDLDEVQAKFSKINSRLFELAGREMWGISSEDHEKKGDPKVPIHALKLADEIFIQIISDAWKK